MRPTSDAAVRDGLADECLRNQEMNHIDLQHLVTNGMK
jgi:hypothetical protein